MKKSLVHELSVDRQPKTKMTSRKCRLLGKNPQKPLEESPEIKSSVSGAANFFENLEKIEKIV